RSIFHGNKLSCQDFPMRKFRRQNFCLLQGPAPLAGIARNRGAVVGTFLFLHKDSTQGKAGKGAACVTSCRTGLLIRPRPNIDWDWSLRPDRTACGTAGAGSADTAAPP